MHIYDHCEIDCDEDAREAYATIGFEFPLSDAKVIHTGTTISIRVPALHRIERDRVVGLALDADQQPVRARDALVDQILNTKAPAAAGRGKGQVLTFKGRSKVLLDMGVDPADAEVGFEITSIGVTTAQPA